MKTISFLISLVVFVFIGCSGGSGEQTIFEYFDKRESKELEKLLVAFDDQIAKDETSTNDSYEALLKMMSQAETSKELFYFSDSLFHSIDIAHFLSQNTFGKIWEYKDTKSAMDSENVNSQLFLKYDGAYQQFLKKLAEEEGGVIEDYYQSFEIAGDLSPAMVAMFQKQYTQLDIADERIRLVIAVHYLTLSQSKVIMKN